MAKIKAEEGFHVVVFTWQEEDDENVKKWVRNALNNLEGIDQKNIYPHYRKKARIAWVAIDKIEPVDKVKAFAKNFKKAGENITAITGINMDWPDIKKYVG